MLCAARRVHRAASERAPYRQGPGVGWMMNSASLALIRKFKDDQDNYIWTGPLQGGVQVGTPGQLLGYPIFLNEAMPSVAANAFPVAFGIFLRGYLIGTRRKARASFATRLPISRMCTFTRRGVLAAASVTLT